MHQVEVDVIHLKIFQWNIKSRLNIFRLLTVVPDLSDDKQLGTRNAVLLDCGANSRLSAITIIILINALLNWAPGGTHILAMSI
jgi:hypothetical protein